jgi:NadR type nicotinamide-nucleotide adenylyltransferase
MSIKKIVIIGPESTGKSTLCEQLAKHYNASWCPEYAREYLLTNGTHYTADDLLIIAKEQIKLEEKMVANAKNNLLFIDTNMYVLKVWSEFVFGKCDSWILNQVVQRTYDLYLLCNTDLPWQKDELREYPDLLTRRQLYLQYKDHLINQSVPWSEVSGTREARLSNAIAAVDKYIPFAHSSNTVAL